MTNVSCLLCDVGVKTLNDNDDGDDDAFILDSLIHVIHAYSHTLNSLIHVIHAYSYTLNFLIHVIHAYSYTLNSLIHVIHAYSIIHKLYIYSFKQDKTLE